MNERGSRSNGWGVLMLLGSVLFLFAFLVGPSVGVAIHNDLDDTEEELPADGGEEQALEEQEESPLPFTISEATTHLTAPINEAGHVDYTAAINAISREGVTPENNAEVLYLEAMGFDRYEYDAEHMARYCEMIGIDPIEEEDIWYVPLREFAATYDDDYNLQYDAVMEGGTWTQADYPLLADWLNENRGTFELIHEGTARAYCYRPLDEEQEGTLMSALLWSTTRQREMARLLTIRAKLRMGEREFHGAWEDIEACHRLALHAFKGPSMIDALVGYTVDQKALNAANILAQSEHLPVEAALSFAEDMKDWVLLPSISRHLHVMERYSYLDMVCHLSTEGLRELGINGFDISPQSNAVAISLFHLLIDWDTVLIDGNLFFDEIHAIFEIETLPERREAVQAVLDKMRVEEERLGFLNPMTLLRIVWNPNPREEMGHLMAIYLKRMLYSVHFHISKTEFHVKVKHDLVQLAFALSAYKSREGVYPQQLAQLVPDYLPEIPIDRFTDEPLHYHSDATGYLAYSVGMDEEDGTEGEGVFYLGNRGREGRRIDDIQIHHQWEEEPEVEENEAAAAPR